mmetsp:Transcript_11962/g.12039  ORF Transcript_11962/g.12039 Transcript_11962/m.12039 type:complete len:111 (-) Transcript_11962:339-671(-)
MSAIAVAKAPLAVKATSARKAVVPAGVSRAVSRKMVVRASAQKEDRRVAAVSAGVVAAAGAAMASPLMAEAAVTPSLRNFLYSLLAGGFVLVALAGAVTAVSNFDPVNRG